MDVIVASTKHGRRVSVGFRKLKKGINIRRMLNPLASYCCYNKSVCSCNFPCDGESYNVHVKEGTNPEGLKVEGIEACNSKGKSGTGYFKVTCI